jgi:hypothetical protein
VIVTGVEALTEDVVMVKVALVAPADTVTFDGTVAAALLLESVTTALPVGAAAASVTVACDEVPPATDAGLSDNDASPSAGVGVGVGVGVGAGVGDGAGVGVGVTEDPELPQPVDNTVKTTTHAVMVQSFAKLLFIMIVFPMLNGLRTRPIWYDSAS